MQAGLGNLLPRIRSLYLVNGEIIQDSFGQHCDSSVRLSYCRYMNLVDIGASAKAVPRLNAPVIACGGWAVYGGSC